MKQIIYKYPFQVTVEFALNLPKDAKILTVQVQGGIPCIWVLFTKQETQETENRFFRVIGTGYDIEYKPNSLKYIGTFQLENGSFIGHLFEEFRKKK